MRSLGYDHHFLVSPVGLSGGLALFWRDSHTVYVLYSDNRLIDRRVKVGSTTFFMTFVYGDPVRQRRRVVWDKLTNINISRDTALFLVGDFNEIMNNSENLGVPIRSKATFYPFRSLVRDCRIKKVPSSGNKLSWAGKREVMTTNGE